MTFLDGAVTAVIAVFALWGLRRGLTHKLVSVGAWVGATLAALWGFQPLGEWLLQYLSPPWFAHSAAAFAIFVAVLSAMLSLGRKLSSILRHSPIGILDRGLGLLFGMAQGLVLVALACLCYQWWLQARDEPVPNWIAEARLFPVVQSVSVLLHKGALGVSSIEEMWPELRFDPSLLPGLAPEPVPGGAPAAPEAAPEAEPEAAPEAPQEDILQGEDT